MNGGYAVHDESEFTPGAQPGWKSWDAWSPEQEFCEFAGHLQRMLAPKVIIETGVGVGRITNYLDLEACPSYWGYEADPAWQLDPDIMYQIADTPSVNSMQQADLVILDSEVELRGWELDIWALHGKPGSVCLVHDAGPQHRRVREAVERAHSVAPGVFLANPRGGWLAVHP